MRYEPAQYAPLLVIPEIAFRNFFGASALACNDEDMPVTLRLATRKEAA